VIGDHHIIYTQMITSMIVTSHALFGIGGALGVGGGGALNVSCEF